MFKLFGEIEDGQKFFFSVFVGKDLKKCLFVKNRIYGHTESYPQIKKMKFNYNDLVEIMQ